jgi:hypothetical protein
VVDPAPHRRGGARPPERGRAVVLRFGQGLDRRRIGAWWVATGGILVATSNSFPQLRDVYWRELRKAHAKGGLPGNPSWGTDLRWELPERGSWAIGRKPDDNDPEGLAGHPRQRVLVIVDEANGVSPSCGRRPTASSSTRPAARLAIGNPFEPTGPFYEACQSARLARHPDQRLRHPELHG